ncbi:MAG: response regulator transcription factor [Candidatus Sericytochromatia bacterium]
MATVLIVDDASGARQILEALLTMAGHEVIGQATDGEAGLALATALQPDLLIVDMLMPRMDGVEVVARYRAERPDARAVMISSVTAVEKIRAARDAGVRHYILKPFEPTKVLAVVAEALAGLDPLAASA